MVKNIKDTGTESNFVPYDMSLKFKKHGFKEPCLRGYDKNETMFYDGDTQYLNYNVGMNVSAPMYQQAKDWFKTKGIYIETIIDGWGDDKKISDENIGYRAFVWKIGNPKPKPYDDIGMSDEKNILIQAFEYAFQMLDEDKALPDINSMNQSKL